MPSTKLDQFQWLMEMLCKDSFNKMYFSVIVTGGSTLEFLMI